MNTSIRIDQYVDVIRRAEEIAARADLDVVDVNIRNYMSPGVVVTIGHAASPDLNEARAGDVRDNESSRGLDLQCIKRGGLLYLRDPEGAFDLYFGRSTEGAES